MVGAVRMKCGREFHNVGAATVNDLEPQVVSNALGAIRSTLLADRRPLIG